MKMFLPVEPVLELFQGQMHASHSVSRGAKFTTLCGAQWDLSSLDLGSVSLVGGHCRSPCRGRSRVGAGMALDPNSPSLEDITDCQPENSEDDALV